MADDKGARESDEFAPEIGDPGEQEADFLFRLQMGIYNFFAGYWRHLLGLLGVFLVGALVFSLYLDYSRDAQRDQQAALAEITRRMPRPDPMAAFTGQPADDPSDTERMANLQEGARRYEAVAQEGSGTAAVMAWSLAAETWERAGESEKALAALEAAHALSADGVVGWSITARLADRRAAAGDVDGAVALYKDAAAGEGIIAEQASLSLALLYEGAGRRDEATALLQTFLETHPESPLLPTAAEALGRLKG